MTNFQLETRPAGCRKSFAAALAAAMLLMAAAATCRAQAAIESVQGPKVAPPPMGAPAIPGAGPTQAAPQVETTPLHTPPAQAGPIQASVMNSAGLPAAFSSVSRGPVENNILHITVGHQLFIDTKSRLRRVYVADPSVLNSVTLTPNQIVLTAMGPGISALTLLDEIGRAQSYMISSDLDMDGLRAAMNEALSNYHINVEGSGGRAVLSGTVPSQAVADSAVKLAGMYAKDVVNALNIAPGHPKQVRLQVRILEVDRAKALQYGINLFNPGGNTSFLAATTTSQYPSTATQSGSSGGVGAAIATVTASNPLNFFLYSARANLGTTIQDLQTKQVLQILAEPTITTISGEKADFLSGGEFPFPIAQPGSGGAAPVITIQFRPYGVKVEFTPIVNDDGTIRLTVAPEVSALDYSNAVSISGFTVPALSTRKASTQVELRSDQSFAISGLLDQRTTDLLDKSPGIASIPILGNLFKSKNVNHSATELVVVVTPTVVDPLTDTEQPVQPDMPIPTLDRPEFDRSLGKNLNPRPAAPPLDPNRPPFGDAVPTPLPPNPNSPDNRIVGDAAPAQTPQSAPAATQQSTPAETQQSAPAATQQSTPAPTPEAAPASPSASPAAGTTPAPAKEISPEPAIASSDATSRSAAHSVGIATAKAHLPREASPAVSAVPAMVEIMALSHGSDADAMVSALKRRGYDVAVNHGTQDSLLHLDVGPFISRSDAETMRQRLLSDGYNATIK